MGPIQDYPIYQYQYIYIIYPYLSRIFIPFNWHLISITHFDHLGVGWTTLVLAAEALLSQCPVELKDVVNPQDAGPGAILGEEHYRI